MEQLVMAIAIPLAKQYGMNKALEIAYEKLGIAAPKNTTEIDILTGGGINQAFSPGSLTNMFKRAGLRLGANTLMKGAGSSLLPFAGIAGLAMLGNKYRKQLTGYDTQSAYEAARDQRIADKRLDYITDRMINNKKTANYEEALLDSGAGAIDVDGVIMSGSDYFPESDPSKNDGPTASIESMQESYTQSKEPRHSSGIGGLHSYYRGGIASL
jgi:hypothetical protein